MRQLSEKELRLEARRNAMRASVARRSGNEPRADVLERRCARHEDAALLALAGEWGKPQHQPGRSIR